MQGHRFAVISIGALFASSACGSTVEELPNREPSPTAKDETAENIVRTGDSPPFAHALPQSLAAPGLDRTEVRLADKTTRQVIPERVEVPGLATTEPATTAAVVDVSGDLMATALAMPGELRILRHQGQDWVAEAVFDPIPAGSLRHWVSVAVCGSAVVVGTPPNGYGFGEEGVVQVYRQRQSGWHTEPSLEPPKSGTEGHFGFSVDCTADTIAVGAPMTPAGGSVTLFARDGQAWRLSQELTAHRAGDRFGWSVALEGDTLVVGAPGDDSVVGNPDHEAGWGTGAAYVFERNAGGSFTERTLLKARDAPERTRPECTGMGCAQLPDSIEEFGAAVALAGDTLVVGAPGTGRATDETGVPSPVLGAAHVFSRQPEGFTEATTLEGPVEFWRFGSSVKIADGVLAVGASQRAPVSGSLPTIVETAHVSVFARDRAGSWSMDFDVLVPVERGALHAHFAVSPDYVAAAGFRPASDGGFVDVINHGRVGQ